MAKAEFSTGVYRLVRRIPYGRVSTYGDIAALLGAPRAARGVGHALSMLPEGTDIPWWRVLNRNGEISMHGMGGHVQRLRLEQEGVRVAGRRVDLAKLRWTPAPDELSK